MNIKQYLKLTDNKFIISTEHLFISYHECNQTNEWESTIINLKTKQHFKNLNTLIDKYPLSHQLNIPVTNLSHHIILPKPNIQTNHISYEECISVKTKTKLNYTVGTDKYTIEINPHTLAQLPHEEPSKQFIIEVVPQQTLQYMDYIYGDLTLNHRLFTELRISPELLLNNVHLSHQGIYNITYPQTNHREIWD
jgi:hypothetical protein